MDLMDSNTANTVVIGDQLFTDMLGGNRLGFLTILVRPVDANEFFATILTRTAEKIALFRLRRAGRGQLLHAWPDEIGLGLQDALHPGPTQQAV